MSYRDFVESIYPPNDLHRQILLKYRNVILPLLRTNLTNSRDDREAKDITKLLSNERLINQGITLNTFIDEILTSTKIFNRGEPRTYTILRYDRESRESIEEEKMGFIIPLGLKQDILSDYENAGYVFTYFGFLNKTEPRVIIYMNRIGVTLPGSENLPIEPTKENYEIASNIITLESYNKFIDRIRSVKSRSAFYTKYQSRGEQIFGGIGWSKRDIVNAIINTGLTQIVGKTMYDPVARKNILFNAMKLDDVLNVLPSFKQLNGVMKPNYLVGFGVVRKEYNQFKQLTKTPTFQSTYYMPKLYYEMIYRKIFNTLAYVDWKQVCQNRTLTIPNLIEASKALNVPIIDNEDYSQICNRLEQYASRQRYAATPGISISQIPQSISSFSSDPRPSFSSVSIPSGYIESSRPSNYPEYQERQGEQSMASMITSGLSEPLKRRQVTFQSQEEMLISEQITILCSQRMPIDEIEKKAYLYDVLTLARKMGILNLFPQDMLNVTQDQICSILSSNVELGEEEFKISRR